MSETEGLIIHFDESRRNELLEEVNENNDYSSFSDALSIYDWKVKTKQVCLISFTGNSFDFISLATKGSRVVTAKSRIEFSELVSLDSLRIDDVEKILDNKVRSHFIKSSQGKGGKVPRKTWENTISAIKKLRPNLVNEIDRLLAIKDISNFTLRGSAAEILLQEREAIGAALDIFEGSNKLRKAVLGGWAPNIDDVGDKSSYSMEASLEKLPVGRASFLSGIPARYIQEETAIQHDLFNWEGISPIHELGVSHFTKGDRSLDVIYANRNALEKTTGVDLIYYNHKYNSFVLVQYKLMQDENDMAIYRPDRQFEEELKRMDEFAIKYNTIKSVSSHEEYRLCNDGFMFKLVPNFGVKPASHELIKGMYVTREYMHFLLSTNGPKGKHGGRLISFGNSPRYLTNSEFSSFVHNGWVGTNGVQSKVLIDLLKTYYETGRAVILAKEYTN